MSTSTTTAQHWRKRAQEMRAIADELTIFPRAQESMLRIADHYERKAVRLRNETTACSDGQRASPLYAVVLVPTVVPLCA